VKVRYTRLLPAAKPSPTPSAACGRNVPYLGRLALNFALEFPSQWFAFLNPGSGATQQTFSFVMAAGMLPANLPSRIATEIYAELKLAEGRSLGGTLDGDADHRHRFRCDHQTLTFDTRPRFAANLSIANWG